VKSLGTWYDGDLKDTVRVGEVRQQEVCSRHTKTLVLSVWSTAKVAVATDCVQGFFDNSGQGRTGTEIQPGTLRWRGLLREYP